MPSDTSCDVRCLHPDAVKRAVAALEAEPSVARTAALFSALGDPTRLRLLLALKAGPLCTCDLAVVLGVTESAVSHQLRTLKALDLVESERQNRMMFHRLDDVVVEALAEVAGRWVAGRWMDAPLSAEAA
jgi:DNA-binding transcriptional ArsR family regulator